MWPAGQGGGAHAGHGCKSNTGDMQKRGSAGGCAWRWADQWEARHGTGAQQPRHAVGAGGR